MFIVGIGEVTLEEDDERECSEGIALLCLVDDKQDEFKYC